MKLILGNKVYSSRSLRGWLLARTSGLTFEEVVIPLYEEGSKAEIFKHSPSGLVPCLIDGEAVVWDTLSILEFLNEKAPSAGFFPGNTTERARHRSICAEIHAGFFHLRNNCSMNLRRKGPAVPLTPELNAETQRLAELTAPLPAPGARKDAVTAVEAFLTPMATRFRSYGLPMPNDLDAYFAGLLDHPLFKEWESAASKEIWTLPQYDDQ